MHKRWLRRSKKTAQKSDANLFQPVTLPTSFVLYDKAGRIFEGIIQDSDAFLAKAYFQNKQVAQVRALLWMEYFEISWEVLEFQIDEEYRRQGLGTALATYVFDYAAKSGADSVWIDLGIPNPTQLAFVQKLGFTSTGDKPANSYWEYELKRDR